MSRIITIGREFGSGGRTIGKMAGEKPGIPVYDNEILAKIAEELLWQAQRKIILELAENPFRSGADNSYLSGIVKYLF